MEPQVKRNNFLVFYANFSMFNYCPLLYYVLSYLITIIIVIRNRLQFQLSETGLNKYTLSYHFQSKLKLSSPSGSTINNTISNY